MPLGDKSLPVHKRSLAEVIEQDGFGETMLHRAVRVGAHDSLTVILESLPESDRLAALKPKERLHNETVLEKAVRKEDCASILAILTSLPQEALQATVSANDGRSTLLHKVARYSTLVADILRLLPEAKRLPLVQATMFSGYSVLEISPEESLLAILRALSENDQYAAVSEPGMENINLLHRAAMGPKPLINWGIFEPLSDGKFLLAILDSLSINVRCKAITVTCDEGRNHNTVLHKMASVASVVSALLDRLPPEERSAAVNKTDSDNQTTAHLAAYHDDSLAAIFDKLPENQRLVSALKKNRWGRTVIHLAADYAKCLEVLLERLPPKDHLAALETKSLGRTVYSVADNQLPLQMVILQALPHATGLRIAKTWKNPLFHWLSPEKLYEYYIDESVKPSLKGQIEEQLMYLSANDERIGLRAYQVLLTIFSEENEATYDKEKDLVISKENSSVTPTYLLITMYFKTETEARKTGLKGILEKRPKKSHSEDWLALAIIAHTEGQEAEAKRFIRRFTCVTPKPRCFESYADLRRTLEAVDDKALIETYGSVIQELMAPAASTNTDCRIQ